MGLPKLQAPQDWFSQLWNIWRGTRVDLEHEAWLLGPIGEIGGIADRFIQRLARDYDLKVLENQSNSGILPNGFAEFCQVRDTLHPDIDTFYRSTSDYDLDLQSQWQGIFQIGGRLVSSIYSRRVQQLNLPLQQRDTARGITNSIIQLVDVTGNPKFTIWFRTSIATGEVIYSGVYSHCRLPTGENCLKIVFPLPQGNATVIMHVQTDNRGNLVLTSMGERAGDAGFYFLVQDARGQLWKNYLASFTENIHVYVNDAGQLGATHTMHVWGHKACELTYRMCGRVASYDAH